jgi:ATP-dependent Lhr-like helicase
MTSLHPSSSDGGQAQTGAGFERLDLRIQRWIWQRSWTELRDIQDAAISAILGGGADVLIAAATASGKTEAAFFPLLTQVAGDVPEGLQIVYVSPLRALINDQFDRLGTLCEELQIPVHRWHGDVGLSAKAAVVRSPRGVLLITPESLEALFVLRGPGLRRLFATVEAVVVDEVHSFIGEERGRQLQSLLHRLELVARRRVRRVGLSATLGDMGLAAEFLRPGSGTDVVQIVSLAPGQELKLQLRGYVEERAAASDDADPSSPDNSSVDEAMAAHLFQSLYGSENLVFCNSRGRVEQYADRLRRLCEENRRPNLFLPHHGSLSKELREDAERLLKDNEKSVTVVCTSTLELGIDIGSVASVAQIGPPPSVASLRQRLGRSGRRGEPAMLRVYVTENGIDADTPPQDQLRAALVQSLAMVELLLERWCEPPETGALHLSTLIQQLLSLIAQHGGATAQQAFPTLCESGPFRNVDMDLFVRLLRGLAEKDVIMQSEEDRTLLLAPAGERIVEHYTFFAAFATPEEYRVVAGPHALGTIPVSYPLAPGMFVIFGGRRWAVEDVDEQRRVVQVSPTAGGRVPRFGESGGRVHDRVRERMRTLYERSDEPAFLNATARNLLAEARDNYRRLALRERHLVPFGSSTVVFGWAGDRAQQTLMLQLLSRGMKVEADGLALTVCAPPDTVADHIRDLAELPPADALVLARLVPNKAAEKHDWLLPEALLAQDYASRQIDVEAAHQVACRIAKAEGAV